MKKEQSTASAGDGSSEITLLLRILDEAYEKKAWHGPNLKGVVSRSYCPFGRMAPAPGPALDCRERGSLRLLEVRRSPPSHRRKTRLLFVERQQLVRDLIAPRRGRRGENTPPCSAASTEPCGRRSRHFHTGGSRTSPREERSASSPRSTASHSTTSITQGRSSFSSDCRLLQITSRTG